MKINPDDIRTNNNLKKKIKNDILRKFQEINADVGHVLPPKWLHLTYYPSLNPKEKASFNDAINELIESSLVESTGDNLRLTKKGVDFIY